MAKDEARAALKAWLHDAEVAANSNDLYSAAELDDSTEMLFDYYGSSLLEVLPVV